MNTPNIWYCLTKGTYTLGLLSSATKERRHDCYDRDPSSTNQSMASTEWHSTLPNFEDSIGRSGGEIVCHRH